MNWFVILVILKKLFYMNLESTRLWGRPRNKWQNEVWEDWVLVGGEGWEERVYNREEWKKLLRMARNCHILHMPMEWMNICDIVKLAPTVTWNLLILIYSSTVLWNRIFITFITKFTPLLNKSTFSHLLSYRFVQISTSIINCSLPTSHYQWGWTTRILLAPLYSTL